MYHQIVNGHKALVKHAECMLHFMAVTKQLTMLV